MWERANSIIHIFIGCFIAIIILVGVPLAFSSPPQKKSATVKIKIHNPYSVKMKALVTCSIKNSKKRFKETFFLQKRKTTPIIIPADVKECDIWPKVSWM